MCFKNLQIATSKGLIKYQKESKGKIAAFEKSTVRSCYCSPQNEIQIVSHNSLLFIREEASCNYTGDLDRKDLYLTSALTLARVSIPSFKKRSYYPADLMEALVITTALQQLKCLYHGAIKTCLHTY